ncbi:MAG: hypothetical protein NWP80_01950 [Candidatus Gracilibacteria bacterium]|nr:hypothetical protein [Candidatus Gracilibacteria bacterium]
MNNSSFILLKKNIFYFSIFSNKEFSKEDVSIKYHFSIRNISTCLSKPVKIDIQIKIKINQSIFLNFDLGSATTLSLETIFCPKNDISIKTSESHKVYATKFMIHTKKLAGRIIASIRAYVGLQLVKTGPRESHIKIFFLFPEVFIEAEKAGGDFVSNQSFAEKFFHTLGNIVIIPSQTISPPENIAQKLCGTQIKKVVAFRNRENTIIERASDAIITNGHFLSSGFSILPERIIGRSGSTHGARIVSTQAKNETNNKSIFFVLNSKEE